MPLSADFKYRELVAKTKHVRTPAGEQFFHEPIGTPITAAMEMAAKIHSHGGAPGMPSGDHVTGAGHGDGEKPFEHPLLAGLANGLKAVVDRLKLYDAAIADAKSDDDLHKVMDALDDDKTLPDGEYHRVIDNILAHSEGKPYKPLAARYEEAGPTEVPRQRKPQPPPVKRTSHTMAAVHGFVANFAARRRTRPKTGAPKRQVKAGKVSQQHRRMIDRAPDQKALDSALAAADKSLADKKISPSGHKALHVQGEDRRGVLRDQHERAMLNGIHGASDHSELDHWQALIDKDKELPDTSHAFLDDQIKMKRGGLKNPGKILEAPGAKDKADIEGQANQETYFAKPSSTIDKAPTDGLWQHVSTHPDRFDVETNGIAGETTSSNSYWVTDKKTGDKWMFKETAFPELNEVQNEVTANAILKAAGVQAPTTRYGSANAPKGWLAQRHYSQELDPEATIMQNDDMLDDPKMSEKLAKGKDPGGVARMAVFDYLINNGGDRHQENFMGLRAKDGSYQIGPIDQSLGFEGGAFLGAGMNDDGSSVGGWHDKFANWFGGYRANEWNIAAIIKDVSNNDPKQVRKFLADAIEHFDQVNTDQIKKQVAKNAGKQTAAQKKMQDEWLTEFNWRRDYLKAHMKEVTDTIMNHKEWEPEEE